MSNRDVLLHKADLLLALDAEGKPVDLHHALRMVRELRTALADYEADAIHTCGPDCKRPLCVMRAELAALRAQEPVAWMTRTDTERVFWMNSPKSIFHDATPLYASPAPAAVPDGVREVRYLTDERDLDPEDQHELIIALGGNGDWYVSVLPKGHRFGPTVRLCTSGGASSAVPGLCTAIAGAFRTLAAATQEGK